MMRQGRNGAACVADIFVSYTSSDRDWAFWIAKELEALGHTPRVHEWEIGSGDDIYAWMEARHDAADHVLCVVSDEYLKAPYSTLERNAAIWQAAGKRPGFVLFVAVKPSKLPTLSDHIRRCELFGIPEDAARLRFREFMQKREAPATAAFPGKVFAVSNIPIHVPEHFLGREDSLAAIAAALGRYEGRVAITALHGLRGVGKTTLAAAYAERHRGDYRATWWIRAQTPDGMRADLVALGVRLKWIAPDDKEEPAVIAVMERLRHEGEGILLIYGNAIGSNVLKPYLPRGGAARVLVTSNAHNWRGMASPVEIRLWPKETGADYLIARTARAAERAAAEALSEALGGLPLAHEQAAAYCERLDVSLADYRKRFEAAPAKMLDAARDAPAEYHDRLTVTRTFALAIDEAAKLHPAAEPLIVHAALLAPEPVPLFLFSEVSEKLDEPLASTLAGDGLDEAVGALLVFALVDRETIPDERDRAITTDCIRLHRLVREVATMRRSRDDQEAARGALIEALVAIYPQDIWDDLNKWARARRIDSLSLALVGDQFAPPPGSEGPTAELLNKLGEYRYIAIGEHDHVQTRELHERALAIREKVLGPEHAATADSLNNLAIALYSKGDYEDARITNERALAIREKVLGPEHPATAKSLNNLAMALQRQGNVLRAKPLFERALQIAEKAFGPEHPATALILSTSAHLLQTQGHFAAARAREERALAIRQKSLGQNHPDTASSLNNLARMLYQADQPEKAILLFLRAIAIGEKTLGAEHPRTQRFKSNYARLLAQAGQAAEAHTISEAALAIHTATKGENHPWTKDSARVTADALDALGRGDEAAAVREKYGIASNNKK
jgi:tetratricopeptide (TPR) repeat protein